MEFLCTKLGSLEVGQSSDACFGHSRLEVSFTSSNRDDGGQFSGVQ